MEGVVCQGKGRRIGEVKKVAKGQAKWHKQGARAWNAQGAASVQRWA